MTAHNTYNIYIYRERERERERERKRVKERERKREKEREKQLLILRSVIDMKLSEVFVQIMNKAAMIIIFVSENNIGTNSKSVNS